ncbi:hypothetical protein [Puniceibacterium antarcticum]|nr:hypothetical protein [Puniceibacterium antarcticum]
MAVGGAAVQLDPDRDTLVNVSGTGAPVPSARFMGVREFEMIRDGSESLGTDTDAQRVLECGVMLLPAVEPGLGPFRGRAGGWTVTRESDGQKMFAPGYHVALMTDSCLSLSSARGPGIVEGPFARNPWYLQMLAALRPDGVEATLSATGTSSGATLLFAKDHVVRRGEEEVRLSSASSSGCATALS